MQIEETLALVGESFNAAWHSSPNPVVRLHGPGPEGALCKSCTRLYSNSRAKRYYKCGLRKFTNGPGSDHKVRWPACAKYEERKS